MEIWLRTYWTPLFNFNGDFSDVLIWPENSNCRLHFNCCHVSMVLSKDDSSLLSNDHSVAELTMLTGRWREAAFVEVAGQKILAVSGCSTVIHVTFVVWTISPVKSSCLMHNKSTILYNIVCYLIKSYYIFPLYCKAGKFLKVLRWNRSSKAVWNFLKFMTSNFNCFCLTKRKEK